MDSWSNVLRVPCRRGGIERAKMGSHAGSSRAKLPTSRFLEEALKKAAARRSSRRRSPVRPPQSPRYATVECALRSRPWRPMTRNSSARRFRSTRLKEPVYSASAPHSPSACMSPNVRRFERLKMASRRRAERSIAAVVRLGVARSWSRCAAGTAPAVAFERAWESRLGPRRAQMQARSRPVAAKASELRRSEISHFGAYRRSRRARPAPIACELAVSRSWASGKSSANPSVRSATLFRLTPHVSAACHVPVWESAAPTQTVRFQHGVMLPHVLSTWIAGREPTYRD